MKFQKQTIKKPGIASTRHPLKLHHVIYRACFIITALCKKTKEQKNGKSRKFKK